MLSTGVIAKLQTIRWSCRAKCSCQGCPKLSKVCMARAKDSVIRLGIGLEGHTLNPLTVSGHHQTLVALAQVERQVKTSADRPKE